MQILGTVSEEDYNTGTFFMQDFKKRLAALAAAKPKPWVAHLFIFIFIFFF